MRILAVIPARAGSKGIPNKNIRLLADHPLIYYAIRNAVESKYITDVVVSTDSIEVKRIAEQMHVKCHWRKEELCGDSITLDSVIYDAIPAEVPWDYVVTMQPTSPTLKKDTLDAAIEYTVDNNLDTVISVINAPHLSWKQQDGKVIPNYEERLNRQYLPPNYLETGAFVVSKASIVKPNTRIGSNVSVFEISEDEAVDIDTFSDLQTVASILEKRNVAIYVAGDDGELFYDIQVALELADTFYLKPDIYFNSQCVHADDFGGTTHTLLSVDGVEEFSKKINEHPYSLVLCVSHEILASKIDSNSEILDVAKLGVWSDEAKYYIASKSFLYSSPVVIKENVEKVLICNSMPFDDAQKKLIGMIKTNNQFIHYEFEEIHGVDLYDEMLNCDYVISFDNNSNCEAAILGIPNYRINREKSYEENISIIEKDLKSDRVSRQKVQNELLAMDIKNGIKRVRAKIASL